LWPLIFFALVPLLVAACRGGTLRAFVLGCVGGTVAQLLGTAWLVAPIGRLQGWDPSLAVLAYAAFAASQGVHFGVAAAWAAWVVRAWPEKRDATSAHVAAVAVAAGWVVTEQQWPRVIPWSVADALVPARLLRQAAALSGASGLCFLVVFVNVLAAQALSTAGARPWTRLRMVVGALFLVAGATVYGVVVFGADESRGAASSAGANARVEVAVVQGGMPPGLTAVDAANWQSWSTYSALTRQGPLGETEIVLWPESVLRSSLGRSDAYGDRVRELAREIGRPLLVGALQRTPDGGKEFNAAYLVKPTAWSSHAANHELAAYRKRQLFPFGEYIPRWAEALGIRRWRTTGSFVPGRNDRELLRFGMQRDGVSGDGRMAGLAPSICFEAMLTGVFNAGVRAGAGFLVNLSDDGWFENSYGPDQHLHAVVLRAVETRRWLVRASNSGISAFIDPTGEVVRALPAGETGVLRHRIALEHALTPYVRGGDWCLVACIFAVVVAVVGRCMRPRLNCGQRSPADG
jgi:apolipoprotein N-acyltransferase